MDSEGENILKVIQQVRGVHSSISLLLKAADTAMAEHGWVNAKSDSRALHQMSSSIDRSDSWMPWEAFRFYEHPHHRSVLASISVLLDDEEKRLSEPVLSAAVFHFGKGRPVIDFPYWLCGIYKVIPGRESDGKFREASKSQLASDWHSDYEHVACLTCPLVDVRSETYLRNEVVQKLCSKVEELESRR